MLRVPTLEAKPQRWLWRQLSTLHARKTKEFLKEAAHLLLIPHNAGNHLALDAGKASDREQDNKHLHTLGPPSHSKHSKYRRRHRKSAGHNRRAARIRRKSNASPPQSRHCRRGCRRPRDSVWTRVLQACRQVQDSDSRASPGTCGSVSGQGTGWRGGCEGRVSHQAVQCESSCPF